MSDSFEVMNSFETLGEDLRAQREADGRILEDIASKLKIRARYLSALEEGKIETKELPLAYYRGYLFHYARELGLDADDCVERFKEGEDNLGQNHPLLLPEPKKESMRPSPLALLLSVAAGIAVFVFWYQGEAIQQKASDMVTSLTTERGNTAVVSDAETADKTTAGENSAQPEADNVEQAVVPGSMRPLKESLPDKANIVLLAKHSTWIQLKSEKGDFLREVTLLPGDSFVIPERDDLTITAEHAQSIEVFVDGKEDHSLGTLDKVIPMPVEQLMPASGKAAEKSSNGHKDKSPKPAGNE